MKRERSNFRQERRALGLTLAAVAAHYGTGITAERVRQIEVARRVRPQTRAAYRLALVRAARQQRAIATLVEMLTRSSSE